MRKIKNIKKETGKDSTAARIRRGDDSGDGMTRWKQMQWKTNKTTHLLVLRIFMATESTRLSIGIRPIDKK